jgi:hypothetical protein
LSLGGSDVRASKQEFRGQTWWYWIKSFVIVLRLKPRWPGLGIAPQKDGQCLLRDT